MSIQDDFKKKQPDLLLNTKKEWERPTSLQVTDSDKRRLASSYVRHSDGNPRQPGGNPNNELGYVLIFFLRIGTIPRELLDTLWWVLG